MTGGEREKCTCGVLARKSHRFHYTTTGTRQVLPLHPSRLFCGMTRLECKTYNNTAQHNVQGVWYKEGNKQANNSTARIWMIDAGE